MTTGLRRPGLPTDLDDDRTPSTARTAATAAPRRPYRGQARWHRPVAWMLALLMGIGMVALAFTAVYRGASGNRQDPVPPPATSGPTHPAERPGSVPSAAAGAARRPCRRLSPSSVSHAARACRLRRRADRPDTPRSGRASSALSEVVGVPRRLPAPLATYSEGMAGRGDPPEGTPEGAPGGGEDEYRSVVFDESFVRAARLQEFSAQERMADHARAVRSRPPAARAGASRQA